MSFHTASAGIVPPYRLRACTALIVAVLVLMVIPGCAPRDPVGGESYDAPLLYMSPETPKGESEAGIVYREVYDFESFLAESELPVLILVSDRQSGLDSSATLLLERLAYDLRGTVACLRVENDRNPGVLDFCGAGLTPCFALTEKGALLRSTGGMETVDPEQVDSMLLSAGVLR